jgi:hypothetical protein
MPYIQVWVRPGAQLAATVGLWATPSWVMVSIWSK